MHDAVISWIGWAMAILFLAPHARSWWRTHELLGGIDSATIRQMLYLCRFTGQIRILGLSLVMVSALVCVRILGAPIPSGVIAAMASVALVPFLRLTLPPAVLFLAGSSERATTLFFRLHLAASPLRVVALLDPHRMGSFGHMLRLDLMRTSTENTWKSMIHRLIDIAPVFAIDTIHRTGPVRYEAFLMLAPERSGRTVFISDDHGNCPSLLAEGIDPSEHAIPVAHAGDMDEAVLRLLHVWRTLPKDKVAQPRSGIPVIKEDWDSLPSVLMIALVDGLDGGFLLTQARETDKSLIALLVPLSSLDEDAAKASIELSWDFSRNPRLVGLYLQNTGLAMVRREFLLQNAELLDVHVPAIRSGRMSFEDLNKPEPVGAAVYELCARWRSTAERCGLEFRFARR